MGTYEKSFIVDGEEYELYRHDDDGEVGYQLVTQQGELVNEGLLGDTPSQPAVEALVRERRSAV